MVVYNVFVVVAVAIFGVVPVLLLLLFAADPFMFLFLFFCLSDMMAASDSISSTSCSVDRVFETGLLVIVVCICGCLQWFCCCSCCNF